MKLTNLALSYLPVVSVKQSNWFNKKRGQLEAVTLMHFGTHQSRITENPDTKTFIHRGKYHRTAGLDCLTGLDLVVSVCTTYNIFSFLFKSNSP